MKFNLIFLCIIWTVINFDFNMINVYIKYIPGDIFWNTIAGSTSGMISGMLAGLTLTLLGNKKAPVMYMTLACVGGLALALVPETAN
jgi:hypothetical protein